MIVLKSNASSEDLISSSEELLSGLRSAAEKSMVSSKCYFSKSDFKKEQY